MVKSNYCYTMDTTMSHMDDKCEMHCEWRVSLLNKYTFLLKKKKGTEGLFDHREGRSGWWRHGEWRIRSVTVVIYKNYRKPFTLSRLLNISRLLPQFSKSTFAHVFSVDCFSRLNTKLVDDFSRFKNKYYF